MSDLHAHLRSMAGYNAWANRRLYAAAQTVPDDAYRRPVGVFFGSLHGTLNHLLVTDRIWLRRLTGSGDAPDRLDAILFDRLADLHAARVAEDRRIEDYVAGLTAGALATPLAYRTTSGAAETQPLWQVLAHLFNHQTHHRGQAHAALTRLGAAAPSLDLVVLQREQAASRPA